MYKIKDSTGAVIYEGKDGNEVYRLLTAKPEDISEEDEVNYSHILYGNITWTGDLRLLEFDDEGNLLIYIKFRGIDDWNRPVFKDVNRNIYYGSVNKLFSYDVTSKEVCDYFKDCTDELEYFGSSFNCEPHGGLDSRIKLVITK